MSQSEGFGMLPPSYEEAVNGVPSPEAPNGKLPVTDTPIESPQPPATPVRYHASYMIPPRQYISPQHITHNVSPQPYGVCPPGAEPLLNLHEILVYPSRGRKYKIKNHNKEPVMVAKYKWEGDCCDCCTCDSPRSFILSSLNGENHVAQALSVIDSVNCCSYNQQHMEVRTPYDALMGEVRVPSLYNCTIVNQSGDVLLTLDRKNDCCPCNNYSYQIFSASGVEVGRIDNSRGIKNRLTFPREMLIQHKILLLFFTLFLQHEQDEQRRSD